MLTRRRLRQFAARSRRPLLSGLVLFGYLLASLGIPLPVRAAREVSQPFPCQNHSCGCRTADQCWEHCCCFTPEQKLAWAREHNVEPPAFVKDQAGWNEPRQRERAEGTPAPCKCSSGDCATQERSAGRGPATAQSPAGKQTTWLNGLSARQCQGHGTSWLSAIPALPPPPFTSWNFDWAPVCWLASDDCVHAVHVLSLPDPPPRA